MGIGRIVIFLVVFIPEIGIIVNFSEAKSWSKHKKKKKNSGVRRRPE